MKRLALLLPLLALALPALAQDPATNAPAADFGALARQGLFERIIGDVAIEWRDAKITDVAEFLGDASRSQMYMEHGATNAGIPFLVGPYAGEESFRTNEEPRVSFALAEGAGDRLFSLAELSKLAAEAAGMNLSIHPDFVIIHGPYEEVALVNRLFEPPAGLRAAVAREPFDGDPADEGARLRAFFAARGVEWPDGSLVDPIPSNEWVWLKVIQTSEHLKRIGEILAAPGFSVRKASLRPRLLAFEDGRAPDGLSHLPRPDRRLLVRRVPAAEVAAVAAAFADARGAVVRDLGALPGENGLMTRWDSRPPFRATEGNEFFDTPWAFSGAPDHPDSEVGSKPKNESWRMVLPVWNGIRGWTPDERAAGVTLEVTPRFSSDGSALSLHYVLRSLSETPAGSAAPLAPPHGCAGDIELAPGDALLLGTLRAPVRPGEPPRFLAMLLETATPSPAEETHAASAGSAEPEPRAASAEHRLDEVKELYATGEYAKARTRLEAVLKDEPGNERARSLLLRVVDRERREQEDDLRWKDFRRQAIKSVQPCRRPEGRDKAAREEDPMATPAMLSPAEEPHAESAEDAGPEPHAESAEGAE